MGSGMTVFLNDQVQTMEEWDEVCKVDIMYDFHILHTYIVCRKKDSL